MISRLIPKVFDNVKSISLKILIIYIIFAIVSIIFFSIIIFENQIELISGYSLYKAKDVAGNILVSLRSISYERDGDANGEKESDFEFYLKKVVETTKNISDDFVVFEDSGKVLYSNRITTKIFDKHKKDATRAITNKDFLGYMYYLTIYEKDYRISYYIPLSFIPDFDNTVLLINLNLKELDEYKGIMIKLLIVAITAIILFYFLMALFIHNIVVKPIKALHKSSIRFGNGDFSKRVIITNNDEVGNLGRAFNTMADALQDKIKELEKRNKLMQMEIEMAGNIQKGIFPVIKETDHFRVAVHSTPMVEVCSDYYDFTKISRDKYGFFIADVSGHGVPTALITMTIKDLLMNNAVNYNDPKDLFIFLNTELSNIMSRFESFFTAFYFILENNEIRFCNARHTKSYLIPADGNDIEILDTNGYSIGISEDANPFFESKTKFVSMHDKIILLSDGIANAMNSLQERFEENMLPEVLRKHHNAGCEELVEKIIAEKNYFTNNADQIDDETLIILEIIT